MVAEFHSKDATYREPIEPSRTHGIPVFSPLCDPSYRAAMQQSESEEDIRWGVPKVPPPSPAQRENPSVPQFNDIVSAHDFSLDPTYSERAVTVDHILPRDMALPALNLYHKLKALERDALNRFRNEQIAQQRAAYIKPGDISW